MDFEIVRVPLGDRPPDRSLALIHGRSPTDGSGTQIQQRARIQTESMSQGSHRLR